MASVTDVAEVTRVLTHVMLKFGPSGNRWLSCTRRPCRSPPRAPAENDDSLSPSDSERSECTATIAKLARMLSDLESKMGPSHPATILLRTCLEEVKKGRHGTKPLLEKIQAAEKRLKARQRAVEATTAKRDQLQHSLQASQERCDGSRRQSSCIYAHRWQLTCRWQ